MAISPVVDESIAVTVDGHIVKGPRFSILRNGHGRLTVSFGLREVGGEHAVVVQTAEGRYPFKGKIVSRTVLAGGVGGSTESLVIESNAPIIQEPI